MAKYTLLPKANLKLLQKSMLSITLIILWVCVCRILSISNSMIYMVMETTPQNSSKNF